MPNSPRRGYPPPRKPSPSPVAVTKGYNDTSAEAVKHTADLAIQTVALGQTTFPELAASIGTVTPLAASLGVAQEDLFAVMATGAGVTGTSSQVATQFRGILQSLMAPTDSMTKLYKKMGYSSGEAMLKQEGLQGTLDAIVSTAEGTRQATHRLHRQHRRRYARARADRGAA